MAIDFTLTPELEEIRSRVRAFIDDVVKPAEHRIEGRDGGEPLTGRDRVGVLIDLRKQARSAGLWLPHMPPEWGGMGLGHVALAMVQAEAAKSYYGPWVLNCQAPDEGNMHTLLHWATPEQAEKYLRPLCEGTVWSCFAMTEPEVAGSDPTLIQTRAYPDGDEWVINGHKWFISNAHRADFAILVCRTEDDPNVPQAANSAFIIDLPHDGWTEVRQIETMHGSTGHSEILIEDLRGHNDQMLGGRGQGHLLGQHSPGAVGIGDVAVGHLALAGPALHLAHGLGDVAHAAAQAGLTHAQLAAVGVERPVAVVAQAVLVDEPTALALGAEPGVLDGQ